MGEYPTLLIELNGRNSTVITVLHFTVMAVFLTIMNITRTLQYICDAAPSLLLLINATSAHFCHSDIIWC